MGTRVPLDIEHLDIVREAGAAVEMSFMGLGAAAETRSDFKGVEAYAALEEGRVNYSRWGGCLV